MIPSCRMVEQSNEHLSNEPGNAETRDNLPSPENRRPKGLQGIGSASSFTPPTISELTLTTSTLPDTKLEDRESLAISPVLQSLRPDELDELVRLGSSVNIAAGSRVNTPPESILVICSGEADFYLFDAADKEFLLSQHGPGTILGELSYLTQRTTEDEKIKIIARTDIHALKIPIESFFSAVLANPHAAEGMLKILADRLSAMNRFTKQAVDINMDPTEISATNWKERYADKMTSKLGSFSFLGVVGGLTVGWVGMNAGLISTIGWDPYPFVFLNLIFSIMSAATASVVLISQNRQSQIDRIHARSNSRMTLAVHQQIGRLRSEFQALRRQLGAEDVLDD